MTIEKWENNGNWVWISLIFIVGGMVMIGLLFKVIK